jgi:hypothetical protein
MNNFISTSKNKRKRKRIVIIEENPPSATLPPPFLKEDIIADKVYYLIKVEWVEVPHKILDFKDKMSIIEL